MFDYSLFTTFIKKAVCAVETEYYSTAFDNFYNYRDRLRNFGMFRGERFIRYSERGFAYEFYFQLRTLIQEQRRGESFFPDYFLQGEIKKMDIEEVVNHFGYERLGSHFIPDMLFHVPSQDANAFVIEIKVQPELEDYEVLNDLEKLSLFLLRFHYKKAVFIAVNIPIQNVIGVIQRNESIIRSLFKNERLNDCNIMIRESGCPNCPIYSQTLSQILE